ncbi:MAG TPA: hypothetical protein VGV37_17320 [Aliidongia sp.]|uniref:hypothetical protein n=1 Tax=Aliidongia sp. TaxID=1914230 RepID=UPI002DDCF13F|nr:hypothetical protein [Aliidongia sp.]HEV2676289.1 hypothetical protein [Aliidongia sp.]
MTRQARTLLLVVALILVGTVSSALTRVYDRLPDDAQPLPPLADGLSTVAATARQQFADRVRERFAAGSDERVLMLELWKEGFEHPGEGDGRRHWASLERRSLACTRAWTVTWTTDEGGHLATIDGTYIPSCS